MYATRLDSLMPSPTLSLSAKIKALSEQGEKIIDLGVGEPDFHTPQHIKDAAIAAINNNHTRYTATDGIPALKQAIIRRLKTIYGLEYDAANITVGNGAKHVIFNTLFSTLNPGDDVLVVTPYWVSYPEMVTLCQGSTNFVKTGENLKLTANSLSKSLTPKTKWFILNSPSNPTGVIYSKAELLEFAEVLRDFPRVQILSDDIYSDLCYDSDFYNLATVAGDLVARSFIVSGVSKGYSMTGWRIGYGAGNTELIKKIAALQSHTTSNPCSIAQYAAVEALTGNHCFQEAWRLEFRKRRDLAVQMLQDTPGLSLVQPMGTFYCYVNCSGLLNKTVKSDNDLCQYFLQEAKVALVPGSAFGMSPYFRLSYALHIDELHEGLLGIQDAAKKLLNQD